MTPNEYADFWRYEIGVNVIPANSKQKIPLTKWTEYQNNPIPKEIHDEWKKENLIIIKNRLTGWQLESFEESYTYKIENGISLFKKSLKNE